MATHPLPGHDPIAAPAPNDPDPPGMSVDLDPPPRETRAVHATIREPAPRTATIPVIAVGRAPDRAASPPGVTVHEMVNDRTGCHDRVTGLGAGLTIVVNEGANPARTVGDRGLADRMIDRRAARIIGRHGEGTNGPGMPPAIGARPHPPHRASAAASIYRCGADGMRRPPGSDASTIRLPWERIA